MYEAAKLVAACAHLRERLLHALPGRALREFAPVPFVEVPHAAQVQPVGRRGGALVQRPGDHAIEIREVIRLLGVRPGAAELPRPVGGRERVIDTVEESPPRIELPQQRLARGDRIVGHGWSPACWSRWHRRSKSPLKTPALHRPGLVAMLLPPASRIPSVLGLT